jgi:hypothetical protein
MRVLFAAGVAMTISAAVADEIEDAHRQALAGRDTYWNCLAGIVTAFVRHKPRVK